MFRRYTPGHDVDNLIAKGRYSRAAKLLREMLGERPKDIHLRQKLADVLARSGLTRDATAILERLVEEFAGDGFLAKAIAVVKKIQRIEPARQDLDGWLASLASQEGPAATSQPSAAADPPTSMRGASEAKSGTGGEVSERVLVFQRSALFSDFSADELEALIRAIDLLTFEPGEIVIAEGEPGSSLLVLAGGSVRVYVRNEINHQVEVRRLGAGEFFGEISILTGQARTATVTAAEPCEILELDQPTLDEIGCVHPHVAEVIREFCEKRAGSPEEMTARQEIELPL